MLKDVKLGFQLLKYSYRLNSNIMISGAILLIGVLVEILSKGTSLIGGVYFMLAGMFVYQLILSMDISQMIQSTGMKKRLQLTIPVIVSTLVYMGIYTFLVIERAVLIHLGVADRDVLMYTLFNIIAVIFTMFLFTSICYKYYVAGLIVFLATFLVSFSGLQMGSGSDFAAFICNMNYGVFVILGYAVILFGAALEYFIGKLLYRKPLSEFAFRGMFRDAK